MFLERLAIYRVRNIQNADFELSPRINLFFGMNGSGKTSVLEAVHVLSRGRSFRSRHLKDLITRGQSESTVFGKAVDSGNRKSTTIGVSRDLHSKFVVKIDGELAKSASQLSQVLPLQLLNAESFDLLTGPPAVRRAFLDWGVFHVEHDFRNNWSLLQRCLKQRNSLLRHVKIDPLQLSIWDNELCGLAEKVTLARRMYLEKLKPVLMDVVSYFGLEQDFSFQFYKGWKDELSLVELLKANLARDKKSGFTQAGPHRAEIRIHSDGAPAANVLSRGQTKMVVSALKLAQAKLFYQETGYNCLFLLDDLPSELDGVHRAKLGSLLYEMGVQMFLTAVDLDDLKGLWGNRLPEERKMFHVEQGSIRATGFDGQPI